MLPVATAGWFNFRSFRFCSLCFPRVSEFTVKTNNAFIIKMKCDRGKRNVLTWREILDVTKSYAWPWPSPKAAPGRMLCAGPSWSDSLPIAVCGLFSAHRPLSPHTHIMHTHGWTACTCCLRTRSCSHGTPQTRPTAASQPAAGPRPPGTEGR